MLRYIELKSGYADNGPAWIARVRASKSGKTIYFNGKALKRGAGVRGNHFDLRTGEEYWVSGVKRRGNDRHGAGSGRVQIEESAVAEYLATVGAAELDTRRHTVIPTLPVTDAAHFTALENELL